MTWDDWTPEERRAFLALADVLLPGNGRLPRASDAGIADCLGQALDLRSDLEDSVRSVLPRVIAGEQADEVVGSLDAAGDLADLFALTSGAYCMSPTVWTALGYPGQEAREVHDETDSFVDLLMPVFDRGPTYRPTPPARAIPRPDHKDI